MTDLVPTTEAQASVAHQVAERIRANVRAMRGLWVRLAEDLHKFHELEMWRDLGYGGFEEWLASPDIELERRRVYELIGLWREFVVKRGVQPAALEPIRISKASEVLPAIRRGLIDVDAALADCETLASDDLRTKYRGVGTGGDTPTSPNGQLDATSEPEFAICHACGSRYRVGRAA